MGMAHYEKWILSILLFNRCVTKLGVVLYKNWRDDDLHQHMGDITDGDKDNGVTDTLDALSLEWQQKNGVSIDQLENSSVQKYCPHYAM